MRLAAAIVLVAMSALQALALDIAPGDAGKAFARTAAAIEIKDIKAEFQQCTPGDATYLCRFRIVDGVFLVARGPFETDRVTGLGLYFTNEDDVARSSKMLTIFLTMLDPKISREERNRIIAKLLLGALQDGATELGDTYTITASYDPSVGVRILADVK